MQGIAVVDIDGVLDYYPQCWVDFVNASLGTTYKDLYEVKQNMPYSVYKNVKEMYRVSGIKEDLAVRENAAVLLNWLHDQDYYIIVMTARPIVKYNDLLMQTTRWLNKNALYYDFLYFSDEKHLDILRMFQNISFVVEDNRYFANEIAKQGYPVYLVNNMYNQGNTSDKIQRVENLIEIIKGVKNNA